MRKEIWWGLVALGIAGSALGGIVVSAPGGHEGVSFKAEVAPLMSKYCLPCHAEERSNPSELSLDSYENLMAGGKHGVPVRPGKATESILFQKLSSEPPFGDKMPLERKKRKEGQPAKKLTDEELTLIRDWIDQGAQNN